MSTGSPEDHIFYSRDVSFTQGIQHIVKTGVDVILNSLAGENLVASWECIALFGRFIKIRNKDILSSSSLAVSFSEKNTSFHALDIALYTKERPAIIHTSISTFSNQSKLTSYTPRGHYTSMILAMLERPSNIHSKARVLAKLL